MPRISKKAHKIVDMGTKPARRTLAADRLTLLISQLVREGRKQKDIAEDLGVDRSLPSRLLGDPSRGVYQETIEAVLKNFTRVIDGERYQLRPTFFSDTTPDEPNYRDYLLSKRGQPAPRDRTDSSIIPAARVAESPAEPLKSAADEMLDAMNATPAERARFAQQLKLFNWPFVNGALVQAFIAGVRAGRSMTEVTDAALNASIDAEIRKDDD